jgi:integrase/recombinase XerD
LETEIRDFLASLVSQSTYSDSTRAAYASDVRIFFEYLRTTLHRIPQVSDFTPEQVAAFFLSEQNLGRQASTLLRRRAALQRFEKFLLSKNILMEARLKEEQFSFEQENLSPDNPDERTVLTEVEVNYLLTALKASPRILVRRDHAILSLLLETGLSVTSLIALNLSDLDLRSDRLRLVDAIGEDCWLSLGAASRSVECFVNEGRPELHPSPDEPALFVSQNGSRMSRQSVWQVLRHWGKTAGLEGTLSPRLARHTAALRLVKSGRPIAEIRVLLGHRNPISTQALLQRLQTASLQHSGQPLTETVKGIKV